MDGAHCIELRCTWLALLCGQWALQVHTVCNMCVVASSSIQLRPHITQERSCSSLEVGTCTHQRPQSVRNNATPAHMEGARGRLEIGCCDCGNGEGPENLQWSRVGRLALVAPPAYWRVPRYRKSPRRMKRKKLWRTQRTPDIANAAMGSEAEPHVG